MQNGHQPIENKGHVDREKIPFQSRHDVVHRLSLVVRNIEDHGADQDEHDADRPIKVQRLAPDEIADDDRTDCSQARPDRVGDTQRDMFQA